MNLKLKNELKIGIIVAFGLAALIWGVPFLKGSDIFSNQKKVFAVYSRVDGVAVSNPVQINGLKIGQIEKMGLLGDGSGRILVTMLVEGKVEIPRHSTATIISSDILGSKAIQIDFSKDTELLKDKDTLNSAIQLSITEEISSQVSPIKAKAEKLLVSIDSLINTVQSVLSIETRNNLSQSFETIKHAINTLNHTTFKLDTLVLEQKDKLSNIFSNVESISQNIKNNNGHLSKIIQNFSAISDTIVKANIGSTLNNMNRTLAETSKIFQKINKGEGSVGLLLNNDSLYNNLNNASRDLDLLLADVKENPSRYVSISVFGGGGKSKKKKK